MRRTDLFLAVVAIDHVLEVRKRLVGEFTAALLLVEVGDAVETGLLEMRGQVADRTAVGGEELEDVGDTALAKRRGEVLRGFQALLSNGTARLTSRDSSCRYARE